MKDLNVTVIEQPGQIGANKARALCDFLLGYYAEHREEIDRMVEERRAQEAAP